MFRMVSGAAPGMRSAGTHPVWLSVVVPLLSVLVVSSVGLGLLRPPEPQPKPGETEMAQRSAAVIAANYRAHVDIDHRDRMLLVSYDGGPVLSADRFAESVCATIRAEPASSGSGRVLRGWQVVAMPSTGVPGSCLIGDGR